MTYPAGTRLTIVGRDGETVQLVVGRPVMMLEGGRLVRLVVEG